MLYKYFEQMTSAAEKIAGIKDGDSLGMTGSIDGLDMGEWIPGKNRIQINGKTEEGKDFELILEVSECQKSE